MTKVDFTYSEIIDHDWTAIDVTISHDGLPVAAYRNYNPDDYPAGDICGNQSETFTLPSVEVAIQMIESCGEYTRVMLPLASAV